MKERARLLGPLEPKSKHFSWLRLPVLWASRNDKLDAWAKWLPGVRPIVNESRARWVNALAAREGWADPVEGLKIQRPYGEQFSFLLTGDPGEADYSQYVTVPVIESQGEPDFMVICSDVVYPTGDGNQYPEKVYFPYRRFPAPIFAVPGNHDWYDLLGGFMKHFCDLEPQPGSTPQMSWLQRRLWTKPSYTSAESLTAARGIRVIPGGDAKQPGPYWTVEAEGVLIIGIDTGISGALDDAQGRWLIRVSEDPRPKVLITGKPLIVDGVQKRYPIEWEGEAPAAFKLVSDVVFHPAHKYLAVMGGDIHNYQRYLGRLPDGSWQTHIVAGGGGAFMHATHKIPKVAIDDGIVCTEEDFRCYPLRGDSLSRYSRLIGRQLHMEGLTWISPCQGSLLMADELQSKPSRPGCKGEKLKSTTRSRGALVRHVGGKVFQRFFSEFLDWDDPPMFKHVLRVDVTRDRLEIRCLAATGCAGQQQISPPVEDEVVIPLKR